MTKIKKESMTLEQIIDAWELHKNIWRDWRGDPPMPVDYSGWNDACVDRLIEIAREGVA